MPETAARLASALTWPDEVAASGRCKSSCTARTSAAAGLNQSAHAYSQTQRLESDSRRRERRPGARSPARPRRVESNKTMLVYCSSPARGPSCWPLAGGIADAVGRSALAKLQRKGCDRSEACDELMGRSSKASTLGVTWLPQFDFRARDPTRPSTCRRQLDPPRAQAAPARPTVY